MKYGAIDLPESRPVRHVRLHLMAALCLAGCAVLATCASLRRPMTAAAAPTNLSPTTDDDALAYFEGSFGCSYDDDDAFFLDREACVTGDLYTCNHYLLENSATDDGGVGTSGAARPREQCAGDDMGAGAAARAADQLRARVIDRGVGR